MKKLLFGLTFLGSMLCTSVFSQKVEMVYAKHVCCLEPEEFCTDFLGGAWADSIEKPGPFCP